MDRWGVDRHGERFQGIQCGPWLWLPLQVRGKWPRECVYGLCCKPWVCHISKLLVLSLSSPSFEPPTQKSYLRALQRWFVELDLDCVQSTPPKMKIAGWENLVGGI